MNLHFTATLQTSATIVQNQDEKNSLRAKDQNFLYRPA
jgi:hypothetical protein